MDNAEDRTVTDPRSDDRGERFTTPHADRPPTPAEEQVAERVAEDVDLERVAENYEDMTEKGKHVRGEGDLFPED